VAGVTGLDHVTLTTGDVARAAAFYDAALGALGLRRVVELVDEEEDGAAVEAVAWGSVERAVLWVVAGRPATSGLHVCLAAPDRAAVEAFHAAALAAGGTSHDAPRRWPIYRAGRFNAIVADPDGNLVEAVAPE
jgi:catechol 2,3-dioxygenase-like lactoylglutathione lyase family enzyme